MSADLDARLQPFVGRQAGPSFTCPDAVNEPMIRHWCEALGDGNPAYTDESFAKWSVHGGIVAPPTMLQVWMMKGLNPPPSPDNAQAELIAALDEAGFTSIVATNCEQEYVRYLRPGDVITSTTVIDSVSAEKKTALGPGYFFTTLTTFCDETGAVVGRMMQRYLKFQPAAAAAPPRTGKRPRPAMNQDTEFFWKGAADGELLIQRCTSCKALRHPPRTMCGECASLEWDTIRSTGRGEIFSHVVVHHPPVPGFEMPYAVALVALEEGTRLVTSIVGVDPTEVRIGMPVEVDFLKVDDAVTLPVFKPRS
ncbi:MAG: bifunctional MaoC family dehydratase N-terminal/OB-fold nucleic acid binding domain-containing protein [Actinomycetota bacterium]